MKSIIESQRFDLNSMAIIPDNAIDRMYSELTSGARDLYTFLCRCRNQVNGKCCPSLSTTQDALKLSRARVFALRKELATKGWAEFEGNYAIQLFGFNSLKNKTIHELNKEDNGSGGDSLKNKTLSLENEIEEAEDTVPPSLEIETDNVEAADVIELPTVSLKNKTEGAESLENETATDGESLENKTESLENKTDESQKQDLHVRKNQQREPAKRTSKDIPASPTNPADSKTAGKGSSSKKPAAPKSRFHNHAAVNAYRDILGFKALNTAQADLIASATGAEIEVAPEDWLRFLRELAETGNRYAHNVRVMVLAFNRYKAGVALTPALQLAWDEAQGRTNGGTFNGKSETGKNGNDTTQNGARRTTEDYGIRDCKVL